MTPRIPPPLQGLAWAAVIWTIAVFGPNIIIDIPGRIIMALAIAAIGIIIELISVMAFIKARTTVNPIILNKSAKLVTSGLYKISRNPMYLGMLLLLIAWCIYLGNPLCFLGIFGFVLVMNTIQIKPEERALEKLFGETYLTYKKSVRRWV